MNRHVSTILASASVSSFLVVILYAAYLGTGHRGLFTSLDMTFAAIIGAFCAMLLLIGSMDD